MENNKLSLAISSILGELGAVKQDGENKFQRFTYTTYDEFNSNIKPLLKKHKVAIFPETTEVISHEVIGKTKSGSAISGIVVKMRFTVSCEGDTASFDWISQGRCESGKEIAKAQTEGAKRFEMKLFHSSTKNDVDPDSERIEVKKEEVKKTVAKTTTKPDAKMEELKKKRIDIVAYIKILIGVKATDKVNDLEASTKEIYFQHMKDLVGSKDLMKAKEEDIIKAHKKIKESK